MALIKSGQVQEDHWVRVAPGDPIPDFEPLLVDLDDWRERRAVLLERNSPLGIRLAADQPPELIARDLPRLRLIAIDFPRFNDGRAYSYARLLRERYKFDGEVRAVGNVLRDQYFFMQRCGFDAYEVPDGALAQDWIEAVTDVTVLYQPAADGRRAAAVHRRGGAAKANGKHRPA